MYLTILLQSSAQAAPGGSSAAMWIMLLLIMVVMWIFMIVPQRKQQKADEKYRSELKKGDKVVTIGGIHGTIAEEVDKNDSTILMKIDGDVKMRVEKNAIQRQGVASK